MKQSRSLSEKPRHAAVSCLVRRSLKTSSLIMALTLMAGCASPGFTLFHLEPAQGDAVAVVLADGAVTVTAGYLDTGEQTGYLTERGYEPLGNSLRSIPLMTYLFKVQNRSTEPLTVDPAGMRVSTGFGEMLRPYNYAHFYLALPQGSGREKALQGLKDVIYERPVQVDPNGTMEKLLMFRRPEVVGEEVAILVNGLYLGGRGVEGVLAFRAVDLSR
ncbi:MAG: hypothetical protein P1S46_10870 [bacterium]|nr:hypothetical protein [bacterium]